MKRFAVALAAFTALGSVVAHMAPACGQSNGEAAAIFDGKLPPGYRDWKLISVAHEESNLNDLRAILGNDVAVTASREGKLPYPEGTIIARLAWTYHPLEESERAFGRPQSFVAGPPKNGVQFMVKDSKKYTATGGWGFAHFNDGKPADEAVLNTQHLLFLPRDRQGSRLRLQPLRTVKADGAEGFMDLVAPRCLVAALEVSG
jgi:hypothetical protein